MQAKRHCDADSARFWKVSNVRVKNSIGSHPSYKIASTAPIRPFAPLSRASHLKRAQFLDYQLWVTPFQKGERYPAGDFPNQNPALDGLVVWTNQDRNVYDTDVVVWHIFGVTHCPRPEEWPIMPVEHCGFRIIPSGFFDHSPAMDVPVASASGSHCNKDKKCHSVM